MIGSNKILQTGISGYLDTVKLTFDDFKDNKEKYFTMYLQLLKQAKLFCDNNHLELSVSIPLNYPDNVLIELNTACNQVYLMAYENVDIDYILRKTAEEKTILKNKCVLALRTKDFENRTSMDEAFKKLGFEKAAYHDLDDLIKFDNTSINVKGENEK